MNKCINLYMANLCLHYNSKQTIIVIEQFYQTLTSEISV